MNDDKRNEIQELVDLKIFTKEQNEAVQTTSKAKSIVGSLHDHAVVETARTDETIQKKFKDQAQKSINTELDTIDQELKARAQVANYDANAEACKNYGIDKYAPVWQIKLMRFGSGFWFVIYWLFASVTIAPLNVFFKGIKAFIKNSYIVFIFALICYLLIVVGIPLLIKYFG